MTTLYDALIRLAAGQQYLRLPLGKYGTPYSVNYIPKHKADYIKTIQNENHRVTQRLARLAKCIICETGEISEDCTGDHTIECITGSTNAETNNLPLCARCISSKEKKDLFEWLVTRNYPFKKINLDLIVAYVRFRYQHATDEELNGDAPAFLIEALDQLRSLFAPEYWGAIKRLSMTQNNSDQQVTLDAI